VSRLGMSPGVMLRLGFASYGIGFLLLWLWPAWGTAFAMVACCSLAEVLVPPGIDSTMAAALPPRMRVSGFSVSAAASAAGDAAGLSIGVLGAGQLAIHHQLQLWYGVLAGCAAVAMLMTVRRAPAQPGARSRYGSRTSR
jgi:MFS family permease